LREVLAGVDVGCVVVVVVVVVVEEVVVGGALPTNPDAIFVTLSRLIL
jgi:hypothetical protein